MGSLKKYGKYNNNIFQILSENRMGNDGARAVCDLLSENKTITYVDLKG